MYGTPNWHDIPHTQFLYLYSYDVSHTTTQGSPQRSWRPRGRQATSATRTCSINCARPSTSAAPYGLPAPTPLIHPTPTPRAPHTSRLNTPHSSSHYNSVTSMLLTQPLLLHPAPCTPRSTLIMSLTKCLPGKNATRYASRQSRSVEAWGTTSLPPKAQAASFRVLHPTL